MNEFEVIRSSTLSPFIICTAWADPTRIRGWGLDNRLFHLASSPEILLFQEARKQYPYKLAFSSSYRKLLLSTYVSTTLIIFLAPFNFFSLHLRASCTQLFPPSPNSLCLWGFFVPTRRERNVECDANVLHERFDFIHLPWIG
jgi:hypothetical protein